MGKNLWNILHLVVGALIVPFVRAGICAARKRWPQRNRTIPHTNNARVVPRNHTG